MGVYRDLLEPQKSSSDTPKESAFEQAMKMVQTQEPITTAPIVDQTKSEDKGWLDTAKSYYTATARAYDLASNQMEVGRLAYKYMNGELTPDEKKKMSELEKTNTKINQEIQNDPYVAKAFGTIAPYIVESAKQGGKGALVGSIIGGTVAAAAGNLVPGAIGAPEELLTAPAGALVGAKIGGMFSSLENMRQIEAGQAYMQMRRSGVSHPISRAFAELYGAGSTGIEAVQFKLLGKLIPGGEQIGQKILQSATTQWLSTIGKKTVPEAASRIAKTAGAEAAVESGQQVYQNFTEVLAKETNDYLNNTNLSTEHRRNFTKAITKDVVDTFLMTLTGMGVAGIPGVAVNAALPGQKKPSISKDEIEEVDKIFGREARQGSIDTIALQEANQALIDKTIPEEPKEPPRRMTSEERQKEYLSRQEYTSGGVSRGPDPRVEQAAVARQRAIDQELPYDQTPPAGLRTPEERQAVIDYQGQDLPGVGSNLHPGPNLPPPSTIGPRPFQLPPPDWKVTPEGRAINPVPPEVDATLSPPPQLTGVNYRVTPEGQAVPRSEAQGQTISPQGEQQVVQPQQAASLPSQPPSVPTIEIAAPVLTSPGPETAAPPIPSPTNELMGAMGVEQAQVYTPAAIDPETGQPTDFVATPVDPKKMPYMPPRTKSGKLQTRGLQQKLSRPAAMLRDGTVIEGPAVDPTFWSKVTEDNSLQMEKSIEAIKQQIGDDWQGKIAWLKDGNRTVPAFGFKLDTLPGAPNPDLPTFVSNLQLVNEAGMEKILMEQGKQVKTREENKKRVARPLTEEQRTLIVGNKDWLNRAANRVVSSLTNKRRDLDSSDIRSAVHEAIVRAAKNYNINEDGTEVNYRTADTKNQKFRATVARSLKDYTNKLAIKDRYGSNRLANERRKMEGQMPTRTDDEGNVTDEVPDMLDRDMEPASVVESEPAPPPPPVRRFTGEAAQAYARKQGIPVTKTIEVKKKPVEVPKQTSTATPKVITGKEAWEIDKPLIEKIKNWLMDKTTEKPKLENIYRGVPIDVPNIEKENDYTHTTPWGSVAAKAGKGAFGDIGSTKVFVVPATPEVKFYIGGSLVGDPLERTRIRNLQGKTWDQLLDQAKTLYQQDLTKKRSREHLYDFKDPNLESIVANKIIHEDLRNSSFEADLKNKPGIWVGKAVPQELNKPYPKLRSYDDLANKLQEYRLKGWSIREILESPEAAIIKKGKPELLKNIVDAMEFSSTKKTSLATPSVARNTEHLSPANTGEYIAAKRTSKFEAVITSPTGNSITTHSNEGTLEQFQKKIDNEVKQMDLGGEPRVSISESVTGIPSSQHKITSVKEPTPDRFITPKTLSEILSNEDGGSELLTTVASKATKAIGIGQKSAQDAVDFFNVEAQWKRKGMPEIGFVIKNVFGRPDLEQKLGNQETVKLYKILRSDFGGKISKEDQSRVLLAYEDPQYLAAQPKEWQQKAQRGIEFLKSWVLEKQKEGQSRGLDLDFYKHMVDLYTTKAENTKDPAKKQHYLDMAAKAKRLNFAHIPAQMIFEQEMRYHADAMNDVDRKKYAAKLISLLSRRRDTFTIASFFEPDENGEAVLKLGDITPADVMLSYSWRFGKDMAMLDIRDAIRDHGKSLYRISKDAPKGKEADEHMWIKVPKTMPILETLNKTDPNKQVWLREDFIKSLHDSLVVSSTPRTMYDVAATWIKLAQFYSPVGMFINNIANIFMSGMNPVKIMSPSRWNAAIKDAGGWDALLKGSGYGEKSKDYITMAEHGGFSQPYGNPYYRIKAMAEFLGREQEGVLGTVKGLFDMFVSEKESLRKSMSPLLSPLSVPRAALPMIYGVSNHVAWHMEEVSRMLLFRHFKEQGHADRDAAQFAAKFMGDYSSLPSKAKRALNRFIFTPAYQVTMLAVNGQMAYNLAKTAIDPNAIKSFSNKDAKYKLQRRMVYAAMGALGFNLGVKFFMQSLGGEEEEFGRSYSFEVDTPKGPKKLTFVLSAPTNLVQRWLGRLNKTFNPPPTEQKSFPVRFWDYLIYPNLTPLLVRLGDFGDERTDLGRVMKNPDASSEEKTNAFIEWVIDVASPVLTRGIGEAVGLKESRNPATKYFIEEHGKIMNQVVDLFMFKYMTDTKDIATQKKMKQAFREYMRITKREVEETGEVNEKHRENFKKRMREAAELREKD